MISNLHRSVFRLPAVLKELDAATAPVDIKSLDNPVLTDILQRELSRYFQTSAHVNNGDFALIKTINIRQISGHDDDIFIVPADGFADSYSGISLKLSPHQPLNSSPYMINSKTIAATHENIEASLRAGGGDPPTDDVRYIHLTVEDCAGLNLRFHRTKFTIIDPVEIKASEHTNYVACHTFHVKYMYSRSCTRPCSRHDEIEDPSSLLYIKYDDIKHIIHTVANIIMENIPVADEATAERVMCELGRAGDW